tara:strand:- start:160 stop:567 length:408 start_codon:yes stop_codon:yes gene_type:complete
MKVIYPTDYTDEDKAIYDDLLSRGEILIGKKVSKNDAFLLDLSAKMTINQMKGYKSGLTKEEIDELKEIHRQSALTQTFETPPELYYEGLLRTEDGDCIAHPLAKSSEEYYADNMQEPVKGIEDVSQSLETIMVS